MRPFLVALAFLSRAPVPARADDARHLAGATAFFPAVGALLGALLLGVGHLLHDRLPDTLTAALLVAVLAVATGGLHLDGVADVFDAAGGGRGDRARMLEIMRDSRIGAHGAVALILVLGTKVLAVTEILHAGGGWSLLLAPAAGRWAVVPLMIAFPRARTEGLAVSFAGGARGGHLAFATLIMLALAAGFGRQALGPALAALLAALAMGLWMQRRLGGLTGDVYGAAIELAEVSFLTTAASATGAFTV